MRKRLRKKLHRRHTFDYSLTVHEAAERMLCDRHGYRAWDGPKGLREAIEDGKVKSHLDQSYLPWEKWEKAASMLVGAAFCVDIDRSIVADLSSGTAETDDGVGA